MFSVCKSLKAIPDISKWNINVNIKDMFAHSKIIKTFK